MVKGTHAWDKVAARLAARSGDTLKAASGVCALFRKVMTMVRRMSMLAVLFCLAAGAAYADKTEEANVQSCKRFYAEVANKGNLAVIDELMAADFVEHEAFPGLTADREGVKQFFTMMRKAFPDLKFEVEFYMADGDKVASYLTIHGTHKGEFMGMPASGKKISVRTIDIVRIKDGKTVEHWGVTDGLGMMEQLGAMGSEQ